MPAIRHVWLNGALVDERGATVSVFDRGFLFGDGVYELIRFFRCAAGSERRRFGVGLDLHVARLRRSLELARIGGFDAGRLPRICEELLDANELDEAAVYVQVTRGAGSNRAHVPQERLTPTVFATVSECEPLARLVEPSALSAILRADARWSYCQIKTTSLMGNILALLDANEHGAVEAILHRNGFVSEGAYTNVFAVIGRNLVTPPVDDDPPILHGVTRAEALEAAADAGLSPHVRPLRVEELLGAEEILITSSRRIVSAIVSLDGTKVGAGVPGPAARGLFKALRARIARSCGFEAPALSRS